MGKALFDIPAKFCKKAHSVPIGKIDAVFHSF